MRARRDTSIIALERFIQATRDSGYKGTYSAVSELVDNSLQAGAKRVRITVFRGSDERFPIQIAVLDDGCGMDRRTLREALRFGGSSRFNDRTGFGRYGMGLPNSSLSQARRVEVYTWQRRDRIIYSYIDVDEIAAGDLTEVPSPRPRALPKKLRGAAGNCGTLVLWSGCDRLSNRRIQTIVYKLSESLGRIFRHFIWDGVEISINGRVVNAIDPTFCRGSNGEGNAVVVGQPIEYEIAAPSENGFPTKVGTVTATFTELPVHKWHLLTSEEKRRMGISNRAGVSIVRANREIDYGWFFMGNKRRENYDDWWRCEIRFDPILDEAFGRPQEYLNEILVPDIQNTAKALNMRVRLAHTRLKTAEGAQAAEWTAMKKEPLLRPLPQKTSQKEYAEVMEQIGEQCQWVKGDAGKRNRGELRYFIREAKMKGTSFYCFAVKDGNFILVVNPEHPFYKKVYAKLIEEADPATKELRCRIDLMLLAAARAEALWSRKSDREVLRRYRQNWSDTLATFLNK
ncbi:MAG: ATP-binding protein [Planctomycetota bacterium]|jgi:hypothetical protein